ncbi:MAG: matrixin family metalloprotease [Kineosporiaceae bacterium]
MSLSHVEVDVAHRAPARRRRRGRMLLVLVALAVLVVLAGSGRGAWGWTASVPSLAPADAADAPLGRPVPAPVGHGGYVLLHPRGGVAGGPVRWDPCRPIHVVVRRAGEPEVGEDAVSWALWRLSTVTGLRFVRDPDTDEAPSPRRPAMDRPRYGDRWSPVLVAWTDPREYPAMTGHAGLGGPVGTRAGRWHLPWERPPEYYVSGSVLLNADHLGEVQHWPQGRDRIRAVVLHEFGHLLGLDHVQDASALMAPTPGTTSFDLGEGDTRGLVALSQGPCVRAP